MYRLMLSLVLFATAFCTSGQATIVPRGGERYRTGDVIEIQWDASRFSGNVNIELWDGSLSRYEPIASHIDSKKGYFSWVVPSGLIGDRYRVRVTEIGTQLSMMSGTYFSIQTNPGQPRDPFTVTGINARVTVHATPTIRSTHLRVTWEPGEVAAVDLYSVAGYHVYRESEAANLSELLIIHVADLPRGAYIVVVRYTDGRLGVANLSLL